MRFTRHAKNRMRREKLDRTDILKMVVPENRSGNDPDGNFLYAMEIKGTRYCAVVALDNGELITVYDLRK
ncbi:MAG TPA: DUF4258 domain-containing protein [Solirubrobacterales bacterium]|nr:DUF4258 domain-containing protein [Solirubrobacterales bacterium]